MIDCKGSMIVKFKKEYPKSNETWGNNSVGKYNKNATIKAMNLIMQGYAELIHSCKNCNPYHLDITLKDFKKPFKVKKEKKWEVISPKDLWLNDEKSFISMVFIKVHLEKQWKILRKIK